MTDSFCGYPGDRDEALVTYLYDEDNSHAAARAVFGAHLTTCMRCSDDLATLRGVRIQLARWSPPEPVFAGSRQSAVVNPQPATRNPQRWREIPVWAQVAAALLFLGVSAGISNLDVRYDQNGLSLRTGWSTARSRDARIGAQASPAVAGAARSTAADASGSPWRADLAA